MPTGGDPSTSCEGPSAGHPLSFSHKKEKGKMYVTQQQSIIETYEM